MSFLIGTVLTLLAFYVLLMLVYGWGWRQTRSFSPPRDFVPKTKVSVIIPARNEAANIGACLASIAAQQYPPALLDVIVVDDHSDDATAAIAAGFSSVLALSVIPLKDFVTAPQNAYKKAALSTGVAQSTGDLIITTDADCIAGKNWLRGIVALYELTGAQAIIAPVVFRPVHGVSGIFQSLDFMTMQGITAAVHYWKLGAMANGANFAFSRAAYAQVGGYQGTTHLASGDDYHLLQKLQRAYLRGVDYLKYSDSVIETPPQPSWSAFLQQRIRWASKSGKDGDARLTTMLVLVYLFNLSLVVLFAASFFFPALWCILGFVLVLKTAAELLFLWAVSGFYSKRHELWAFPLLQPLHIAYVVLAGFLGMLGKYQWKGRSVN